MSIAELLENHKTTVQRLTNDLALAELALAEVNVTAPRLYHTWSMATSVVLHDGYKCNTPGPS